MTGSSAPCHKGAREAVACEDAPLISLVGLPNGGKTTIFNTLTGSRYDTVNFPGTTTEFALGQRKFASGFTIRLMDLPGIRGLTPQSPDEEIALRAISGDERAGVPHLLVAVVDATQLERHLYPVARLKHAGFPLIVVLSMCDLLESRRKMKVDVERLAILLGLPVIRIDRGAPGQAALLDAEIERIVRGNLTKRGPVKIDLASLPDQDIAAVYAEVGRIVGEATYARDACDDTIEFRRRLLREPDPFSARLDRVLLHPFLGGVTFFFIMALFFASIFWLAQPAMDLVDGAFSVVASSTASALPDTWLAHLLTDGVILGVAAFAVFIPQIAILFFGMSLLEDSGYMARGAMIVDKPLEQVGLSGRAFVPLLSGFACAIPAMMATRTMPTFRERLLTMLIVPLMVCSARLPVYGLLIAFLFDNAFYGGLTMASLYLGSMLSGSIAAAILGKVLGLRSNPVSDPFLLEMPSLRRPKLHVVLVSTYYRTKAFVQKAGGIILGLAIVLWIATHFPIYPGLSEADQLSHSLAASVGRWMEPLMKPMGLDWRVGVALLCAFAAREVFVGSLALMLGITSEMAGEETLIMAMRHATLADGSPLFTTASCAGLIIFFMYAMQCMSTVAVMKQETGGWKYPMIQLVVFTVVAYLGAVLVFQALA